MSNTLGPGVVRIHLDTRGELSARMAGQLLSSLGEALAAHLGPDAQVHFDSAGRGTWWAQVMVIVGGLTMTAGGTVLAVQALAKEVREGGTPFSRSVPAALDEGDGRSCTISGHDEEIAITVDQMPAYPPPVGEDRVAWSRRHELSTQEAKLRVTGHQARFDVEGVGSARFDDFEVKSEVSFETAADTEPDDGREDQKVIWPARLRENKVELPPAIVEKRDGQLGISGPTQFTRFSPMPFPIPLKEGDIVAVSGWLDSERRLIYPARIVTLDPKQ